MKRLCLCFAAAVCVCLTSCALFEPEPMCTLPAPTMKSEYWNFDNRSFAKLQIDEVADENLYRSAPPFCSRVILLKCTVLADYYDTLVSGTQVILPVKVPTDQAKGDPCAKYRDHFTNDGTLIPGVEWEGPGDDAWKGEGIYLDTQEVMDFFAGFDTIFAYFTAPYFDKSPRPITLQTFYSDDTGETTERDYCSTVYMDSNDLFFVSDGKVDLHSADSFLVSRNVYNEGYIGKPIDFEDYVRDGMDAGTFAGNLRRLKRDILKQGEYVY